MRVLVLVALGFWASAQAQTFTGSLSASDPILGDGSHYRVHTVEVEAGRTLTATLRSPDFDAFLIAVGPGGFLAAVDGGAGGTDARVAFTAAASGTYGFRVTSLMGGETGLYTFTVDAAGEAVAPQAPVVHEGDLSATDEMLEDSSYVDRYTITLWPGERLEATLTSEAFDAYLQIVPPVGERLEDDDSLGGTDSRLVLTSIEGGTYEIWANSLFEVATGPYRLTLTRSGVDPEHTP